MLGLMAVAVVVGIGAFVALLAPYCAYGRIVQSLMSPLWLWADNQLAAWAERSGSYAFYSVDVWLKSLGMARRPDVLQHDLSRRNHPRLPLEIFAVQTGDRHLEMQWLRTLRAQLQRRLHRQSQS